MSNFTFSRFSSDLLACSLVHSFAFSLYASLFVKYSSANTLQKKIVLL